jgi:hypothetical protein
MRKTQAKEKRTVVFLQRGAARRLLERPAWCCSVR